MTDPVDEAVGPVFVHRSMPLEDVRVQPDGDGRTVEAYAAAFDTPYEVRDHEGHYLEVIDKGAFTRVINRAKPQGKRDYWLTSVFYNHGKTLYGTPSEAGAMPIGVTKHIEADSRGVLTVTRYADTPLGNQVLSLIKDGALRGQSFTGQIVRSDPDLRRGQRHRPARDGQLATVRRLEMGLTEYGPTPSPANDDAEIVGVRSYNLADLRALREVLSPAPEDEGSDGSGAAPDEALATDDSPVLVRSARLLDPSTRRLTAALRSRGINP